MPKAPRRPCPHPGCKVLIERKQRACRKHSRVLEARKPERIRGWRLQQRRAAYFAEHPLCRLCERAGVVRLATELDHVIPLEQGGADDWSNLQGLCHDCHAAKTAGERRDRQAVGMCGVDATLHGRTV